MSEMVGVIEKVFEKNGRWALLINQEWYGNGYVKPDAQEGATAKFTIEMNGRYKNIAPGTLQIKPGAPVATGGAPKARGGGGSNYAQKEQYWADKETRDIETQKRISYQAATNTALAMITAAMDRDLIAQPKGKNLGDRFEAFKAIVEEQAEHVFVLYQELPERSDDILAAHGEQAPTVDEKAPADEPAEEWVAA